MIKIALVGMGLVGRAWAISFARAGHDVLLWDEKPDAVDEALRFADEILPDLARQRTAWRRSCGRSRADAPGRDARGSAGRG